MMTQYTVFEKRAETLFLFLRSYMNDTGVTEVFCDAQEGPHIDSFFRLAAITDAEKIGDGFPYRDTEIQLTPTEALLLIHDYEDVYEARISRDLLFKETMEEVIRELKLFMVYEESEVEEGV